MFRAKVKLIRLTQGQGESGSVGSASDASYIFRQKTEFDKEATEVVRIHASI